MVNPKKLEPVLDKVLQSRRTKTSKKFKGLVGSTYGPASKGRVLSGQELEDRKKELESK